jgi:predicted metal-dependent HD superfamily phosphohydrolase
MSPLHDRFKAAVRACIGHQPIKQRLSVAWLEQLDSITATELPETLQQRFRGLRNAMYAENALPNEPAPAAAIRKMSAQQAAEHTATILDIANEIVLLWHRAQNTSDDADQKLLFGRDLSIPERLN